MSAADTIAALATPSGHGGIAVVRVSGPRAQEIGHALIGALPPPRQATSRTLRAADGSPIDNGLVLFFPAPRSFTGEDVLELHVHGAPVVVDMLLRRILMRGARLARPGEFSERAFLNGKLDLAQAEAIADLVNAGSEAAARSALRSLQGEFSRLVHALAADLTQLRVQVEAAIDFPEEEIDFLADAHIAAALHALTGRLEQLRLRSTQGHMLQAGMTLVLAGAPNAGKSSLLNALACEDAAIVSPTPGTTRDIVRARIELEGMPVHVLDTAGLRPSADPIEREGIARACAAMAHADRVLLVIDDSVCDAAAIRALHEQLPSGANITEVYNKIDLTGRASGVFTVANRTAVAVSTHTGAGVAALRTHLMECVGFQPVGEDTFIARRRHLDALTRAHAAVTDAAAHLSARAGELLAEDLRRVQRALGEITGEFTSEDLLAQIFASFCIGK